MNSLVLVGGGGHCHSVIDVIHEEGIWRVHGILDSLRDSGSKVMGYEVLGGDELIPSLVGEHAFLLTVGQIRTSGTRLRLVKSILELGGSFATIVSPRAYIARNVSIGHGTVVFHDVIVNSNSVIGAHCILNTRCLVEHDCTIEDFCHISTAAVVNGSCLVCTNSFVGSLSVVTNNVVVPSSSFIKAGSVFSGGSK